jgi:hypothetical protein
LRELLGGFYSAFWPDLACELLLACSGPVLLKKHRIPGLLIAVVTCFAIDVLIHWIQLRMFLTSNPRTLVHGPIPLLYAGGSAFWMGLTAALVLGAARLRRSLFIQIAVVALAAIVLPPLVSVVLLAVGCAAFGQCL